MKNKVSFDFDSTLSKLIIQKYAKELIERGLEVWICTSRLENKHAPNLNWNDDLFLVADALKIDREKIIFTNNSKTQKEKSDFLNGKGFVWHLDDCWLDLSYIKTNSDLIGISCFGNKNWKEDCEKLLK